MSAATARWLAAGLALAAGALVAAPAEAADGSARICVLYFDNHTGEERFEPLRKGLADMMVTDLAAVGGLEVVERSRLQDVLDELSMQRGEQFDPKTAQRLGKLVGASHAVTGAISAVAPKIRLDVRLIEVKTAKVVHAAKVVGAPDRFFELQEELTKVFLTALGRRVGGPTASPVGDLDTLLDFGQALDLADQGDAAGASKKLGQVVARAPRFKLAQTRYAEAMKALYAAKDARKQALASAESELLARADAELKGKDVAKLRGNELARYFGYRVLRGHLYLALIAKATGADNPFIPKAVPADRKDDVRAWAIAYHDNQSALLDELKALGSRRPPTFLEVDAGDKRRGQELGLGMTPESVPFMSLHTVARSLAQFLALGGPDIMSSVDLRITPTPADMEPRFAARATELLDAALADIAAHGKNFEERETIRALDLYGDVLVALGRPAEAVARWQQVLDSYPSSSEFERIEKKLRLTLSRLR